MALKGASPEHEGEERPDRWALSAELVAVGGRWGIDPERDLAALCLTRLGVLRHSGLGVTDSP